ncbi:hypothetical protein EKD04_018615 [Chloroflexales bacterium ZM16-3]|nr:hypothetical protein [Chloroflexales bacterium ZM16-3]
MTQIWQSGDANLLISDGQGGLIGYQNGSFVNTISGAYMTQPIGGLGVDAPPIYNLPTGQHTLSVDGASLTQATTLDVAQFGPGYAVSVADLALAPGASDQISLAADGSGIVLDSSAARSLNVALSNDGSGEQFTLSGLDVASGDTLSASLANNTLTLSQGTAGAGTYSLNLTRAGANGISWFVYNDLSIGASDTQYIDSTGWAQTGTLQLQIDQNSDGTIDQTVDLVNQIHYVFLPSIMNIRSGSLASVQ